MDHHGLRYLVWCKTNRPGFAHISCYYVKSNKTDFWKRGQVLKFFKKSKKGQNDHLAEMRQFLYSFYLYSFISYT